MSNLLGANPEKHRVQNRNDDQRQHGRKRKPEHEDHCHRLEERVEEQWYYAKHRCQGAHHHWSHAACCRVNDGVKPGLSRLDFEIGLVDQYDCVVDQSTSTERSQRFVC